MAGDDEDIRTRLTGWLGLSRPPYHTFGLLPFLVGTVMAWRAGGGLDIPVFALSLLGIALLIAATCYADAYFADNGENRPYGIPNHLAVASSGPRWAGRSRIAPLRIALTAGALAILTGLVLQFGLRTGPLTLLIGLAGALPGLAYATRLASLAGNGIGEGIICVCYSWLPLAGAYYLQRGTVVCGLHWLGLALGLATFNVILLNEYPVHPADPVSDGTNLLARTGKERGKILYIIASILTWVALYQSLGTGIPKKAFYLYLPVLALSAVLCFLMAHRQYENHFALEWMSGLNIAVYLGTAAACLLAFL